MSIRLIAGLGNPTAKYEQTRHNAGFWFLDEIAKQRNLTFRLDARSQGALAKLEHEGEAVFLLKPQTYMNRSGDAVLALARYWKIKSQQILIVHDELDFQPGQVKLKAGGGHGGHNGLRDISQKLGSNEFYRLRIGIGHPGDRNQVANYVLDRPSVADSKLIHEAIDRSAHQFQALLDGKYDTVMNLLHV